jgi:hypothetical protein
MRPDLTITPQGQSTRRGTRTKEWSASRLTKNYKRFNPSLVSAGGAQGCCSALATMFVARGPRVVVPLTVPRYHGIRSIVDVGHTSRAPRTCTLPRTSTSALPRKVVVSRLAVSRGVCVARCVWRAVYHGTAARGVSGESIETTTPQVTRQREGGAVVALPVDTTTTWYLKQVGKSTDHAGRSEK